MDIQDLLQQLVARKGSDLHVIAGLQPAIRIDGRLTPIEGVEPLSQDAAQDIISSILSDEQKQYFERDKESRFELDFAYGISGLGRFRFNIHKQRGTMAASVRALSSDIPPLETLGLPEAVREFTQVKKGLVLVTGPTGSGKSTTLAALIDQINQTRCDHIITVEDPVEYLHNSKMSYVTQREVGPMADTLSFRNALKYALRQDPDVILIGEMRDYETIGIAITSAETGHLVLGTLHTSSAAQTVSRIIDVFPGDQQPQVRIQLASNLVGVVSQVLLPRIDLPGRVVASELMIANAAIKNNIRAGKPEMINQIIQTSAAEGMQSMDQCLLKLCKQGNIDYEIAKPYIHDKSTHQVLKPYQKSTPVQEYPTPDEPVSPTPSSAPPWHHKTE